jgi:hypothetical protein
LPVLLLGLELLFICRALDQRLVDHIRGEVLFRLVRQGVSLIPSANCKHSMALRRYSSDAMNLPQVLKEFSFEQLH